MPVDFLARDPQLITLLRDIPVVGFTGLVRMSSKCNDAQACVFFEDRCAEKFSDDATLGRVFVTGPT